MQLLLRYVYLPLVQLQCSGLTQTKGFTVICQYCLSSPTLSYLTQQVKTEPLGVLFLVHGPVSSNGLVTQISSQLKQDFFANISRVSQVPFNIFVGKWSMIDIQLVSVTTCLKTGGSKVFKLRPAQKPLVTLLASKDDNPRFLLVIDMHSDYNTGHLVHGQSKSDGELFVTPINDVCTSGNTPDVTSSWHPQDCLSIHFHWRSERTHQDGGTEGCDSRRMWVVCNKPESFHGYKGSRWEVRRLFPSARYYLAFLTEIKVVCSTSLSVSPGNVFFLVSSLQASQ